jgi:hypothetical protein
MTESDVQKVTYEQYDNLTNERMKLLEVISNPEHRFKSITDICKIAGVQRITYYRAMKDQNFVTAIKRKKEELLNGAILPVINTFIKEAIRGSYKHGEALLKMSGDLIEKQEIKGEFKTEVNSTIDMSKLSAEELKQLESIVAKSSES